MTIAISLNSNIFFNCSELKFYPKTFVINGKEMLDGASSIELSDIFIEETRLCDVVRYKFVCGENWNKNYFEKIPISQNPKLINDKYKKIVFNKEWLSEKSNGKSKLIVLILESPHDLEYNANFEPLVPANGSTGDKIDKYVESLFKVITSNIHDDNYYGDYFFAIVNPVKWQASLASFVEGKLNECLRNAVWKKVYISNYKNCRDHFEKMIEELPENTIIINACTGSKTLYESYHKSRKKVKLPINYVVMESIINKRHLTHKFFLTSHPSVWHKEKNRKICSVGIGNDKYKLVELEKSQF